MNIVMRTALPLESMAPQIRRIVQAMDPDAPDRQAADDG